MKKSISYLPLPASFLETVHAIEKRKQKYKEEVEKISHPQIRIKLFPFIGTHVLAYPSKVGFPLKIPVECIFIMIEYRFKVSKEKILVEVIQFRTSEIFEALKKNRKSISLFTELDTEFILHFVYEKDIIITRIECIPNSSIDTNLYASEFDVGFFNEEEDDQEE